MKISSGVRFNKGVPKKEKNTPAITKPTVYGILNFLANVVIKRAMDKVTTRFKMREFAVLFNTY